MKTAIQQITDYMDYKVERGRVVQEWYYRHECALWYNDLVTHFCNNWRLYFICNTDIADIELCKEVYINRIDFDDEEQLIMLRYYYTLYNSDHRTYHEYTLGVPYRMLEDRDGYLRELRIAKINLIRDKRLAREAKEQENSN